MNTPPDERHTELPEELRDADTLEPGTGRGRRGRTFRIVFTIVTVVTVFALVILTFAQGGWAPAEPRQQQPELPEAPQGTVESYASQQPTWIDCGDGFECATVHAPVDWDDPAGDSIELALIRLPAPGTPMGSLFVNPGGPGGSGVEYVRNAAHTLGADLRANYDIVGWDPRGVGASTPVECYPDDELDDLLFGIPDEDEEDLEPGSPEWMEIAREEAAELGAACAAGTGDLIAHVDTMSTVRDLDMLRAIVGDDLLTYLGYSYGTYIGARYADAYPHLVGRLVLDGALDPATSEFDVVREQTRGFELALRAYVTDCLESSGCPLTGTVDQGMAQIGALLDQVDAAPLVGSDGRDFGSSTMLTAIVTPLYTESNWPYLHDLFTSVAAGDADVGLQLADWYYSRNADGTYSDNSTEAFLAINCLDYPSDLDVERMREQAAELEEVAPTIGRFQGYGDVTCAEWPVAGVEERGPVRGEGAAPILVIGTTGDPATPYRWAESLANQLDSGVLVTYVGEGHTAYGADNCINDVVDRYFVDGDVPASDPNCAA